MYSGFSLKHWFYSFYVLSCFYVEATVYSYPQKASILMHLQVYYTHCNILLCFKSCKRNSFQRAEMFRVGGALRKTMKRPCIIVCGERIKLHLERGVHMPVRLCPSATGWGTWGAKGRCLPSGQPGTKGRCSPSGQPEYPAPQNSAAQWPWATASAYKGFFHLLEGWPGCHCMLVSTPMHTRAPPSVGRRWRKRRWLDPLRC